MTSSHSTAPALHDQWSGRHDGDGADHARWHEVVRIAADPSPSDSQAPSAPGPDTSYPTEFGRHIGVLGFRSDEGVRRNAGRTGAADGPRALRAALSGIALHGPLGDGSVAIVDHGDEVTHGEDLEDGQARQADATGRALSADGNTLTVVLGGGHETAWPSYGGLQQALDAGALRPDDAGTGAAGDAGAGSGAAGDRPRWGVLNLDAHFDLRRADAPSSGTPFLQIAEAERAQGRDLNYAVVGIAEASNTKVLFDTARDLGVEWMTDEECASVGRDGIADFIESFAEQLDVLYLTIDLDVLPAHTAPGVSAPAAFGVEFALILHAVQVAARTGKLRLLDVVELNPTLDIDGRTAKAAARLITDAASIAAGETAGE
ncbi:arginase family protein [Helcobacillus massiliensis]|uniref:arginase family protein n=1 Tax=Helcobacillus massiliensis TaxID=521392 RepID=UPI0025559588|nr:arginase family protein [Helcobacillus massiliensis]MDK7741663.1 arginase family protein [Helcobacillus massiliensis]WOO92707.1 arginase family protein [Helcobacillus massiliensis]